MRKHLFLTGMMGSGKTTMGQEISRQLGAAFVDLDEEIVRREGMSIPEIFEKQGEAGFRACETRALEEVCRKAPCVVATGGGIVLKNENVSLMRSAGIVVLLDRPLETMIHDVSAEGRPNLAGGKEERMRTLYAQRLQRYRSTCDLAFDNSGTPFEATRRLMEHPFMSGVKK